MSVYTAYLWNLIRWIFLLFGTVLYCLCLLIFEFLYDTRVLTAILNWVAIKLTYLALDMLARECFVWFSISALCKSLSLEWWISWSKIWRPEIAQNFNISLHSTAKYTVVFDRKTTVSTLMSASHQILRSFNWINEFFYNGYFDYILGYQKKSCFSQHIIMRSSSIKEIMLWI